jgi:hypothetical protein
MVGRERSLSPTGDCPVGRLGQATCGAVSFALALVALGVGYSAVVAVTSVVPLLSTTAIVFAWAFLWLVAWFVLVVAAGVVRERVVGVRTA